MAGPDDEVDSKAAEGSASTRKERQKLRRSKRIAAEMEVRYLPQTKVSPSTCHLIIY